MKSAIIAEGGPVALFGGEPLLMPIDDLAELLTWVRNRFGVSYIQTNGTLVTAEHVALFRQANVKVGISLDGPGELNDARWHGTLDKTRQTTQRAQDTLLWLCREGLSPGLIVTLHTCNASPQRLPRLVEWLTGLAAQGLRSVRVHLLETEDEAVAGAYALTTAENVAAVDALAGLQVQVPTLKVDLFGDLYRLMQGRDAGTSCVWNACDPLSTEAVHGVEGRGERSNCGRTNKDGIGFGKADEHGYERYLALYQTPQADGGCQGCRFFLMCKGQCPGGGAGQDWRNRTEHCGTWMELFGRLESEMLAAGEQPLSLDPRRSEIERRLLAAWTSGQNPGIGELCQEVEREPEHQPATRSATGRPDPPVPGQTVARLPRFIRVSWASERARLVWETRLQQVREARWRAEIGGVTSGSRRCALLPMAAGSPQAAEAREAGLTVKTLASGDAMDQSRSMWMWLTGLDLKPLVAILRPGDARLLPEDREATAADLATLLELPSCCAVAAASRRRALRAEPEWMAHPADEARSDGNSVTITAPAVTNVGWRLLHIAALPYLPCSPNCGPSQDLGEENVARIAALGFAREAADLREILSWPYEWSALHGIAELKTPLLRLIAATDYTAQMVKFGFAGTSYPAEGAVGVRFPYQRPRRRIYLSTPGFGRGLANAARHNASG